LPIFGQPRELTDDFGRDRRGAAAHVRIGPVRTRGPNPKLEPELALLPEAQGMRAARLGVETAVADDLRMMLEEIARPPGPERLLVRDDAQGHLPVQLVAHLAQIEECEERCRRAGLHVARPAPIDLAVHELGAPGLTGPAFARA